MKEYSINVSQVGQTLRAIRQSRGLTLRQACDIMNWKSTSILSEYELGTRNPTLPALERVLGGYGLGFKITITPGGDHEKP